MQTVGQKLQQRRLARGLGLDAVTRATRLTRAVLAALEEDRFDDLPAPVYVRGFLKLYAQYLELEVDACLEGYESQIAARKALAQELADQARTPDYLRDSDNKPRAMSPASVLLLTATAAIAVLFMWSVSRKTKPVLTKAETTVSAPATATGPTPPPLPPAARRESGLPPLPGRSGNGGELPRR